MKNKILLFTLALTTTLHAQDKLLTIDNCVFGARDGFYPQGLTQLNWIKGSENYFFIDKSGKSPTLVQQKATSKDNGKNIISLDKLNQLIKTIIVPFNSERVLKKPDTLNYFPDIAWKDNNTFTFHDNDYLMTYSVATQKLDAKAKQYYPGDADNFDAADGTGFIAYTVSNNLFILENGAPVKVTNDTNINIVNGHSVHREEFGIMKGTFWSPSGKLLAFYRMDQTMVTDYPILDLKKQPAQAKMIKYPMAGGVSHHVTVGIFNTATNKTTFLVTGEPKDQYLTNIAWSPDNKYVYIAVLNRDQDHLWLNRYDAETGAFDKTLFEETDPKYVHPMHPMLFAPKHPDLFVWQSELVSKDNPDGLNEIKLYNTDGKLIAVLNSPKSFSSAPDVAVNVTNVYGFDPSGTTLYFQGAPAGSCDKEIYSVMMQGAKIKMQRLTSRDGTHTANFSDDMKYFIDDYSSVAIPRIQSIHDDGFKEVVLLHVAKDPLSGYKEPKVNLFTITAADDTTQLWCRMIYPPDFDSTKKYRSMTYVYNGPNVQLVTNSWMGGADLFLYYMAEQGFVIFTIDGRGSDNRGMKFEQATFRHLGTQEIADQKKGNLYLRSFNFIDTARMALFGWSFGGFMTTSLMTRTPGTFKCAVAGGPVIDWSYYEVMYTERYMDTPQTNPQGYKEANLLNYVQNLKGKLMLIHGTSDDVVVWQHSLMYIRACIDKQVQTDYYVYPGDLHNMRGKDRVHLLTKVSAYIMTNDE